MHRCFLGKEWKETVFDNMPTRCLTVGEKYERGVRQARAPWQEIEDGPEEGKVEGGAAKHEQRGGKESGDGARGRGGRTGGAQT